MYICLMPSGGSLWYTKLNKSAKRPFIYWDFIQKNIIQTKVKNFGHLSIGGVAPKRSITKNFKTWCLPWAPTFWRSTSRALFWWRSWASTPFLAVFEFFRLGSSMREFHADPNTTYSTKNLDKMMWKSRDFKKYGAWMFQRSESKSSSLVALEGWSWSDV